MRLLLTRPVRESEILAQILNRLGHDTVIEPLLSIEPQQNAKIPARSYQAILVTSAYGARAFVAHEAAVIHKSVAVFAVGQTTADVLEGFENVDVGAHGVDELEAKIRSQLMPDKGPLLYVRGQHVAGNLGDNLIAAGFDVDEVILYEAVESVAFSSAVLVEFQQGLFDGVVLFSPRTARIFCKLIENAGLGKALAEVTLYCLSQNVADSCGFADGMAGERRVIAKMPTQESLIAAI